MTNFLLLCTVSLVFLFAVQYYPGSSHEVKMGRFSRDEEGLRWIEKSRNETSNSLNIRRLLIQVISPHDSAPGATNNYYAGHETASVTGLNRYYRLMLTMDVYGFSLSREQTSSASVWIINGGDNSSGSLNVIQTGWEVSPFIYGDSRTHLFAIWTTDGFQKTGCRNMNCPGFQRQSGSTIALGDVIDHVSQAKGDKQKIIIKVLKYNASGDWLVHYGLNQDNPELIGRFPKPLFTRGLEDYATRLVFGGYAVARTTDLAPMGSGYPATDASAAASMSNIQFIDHTGHAVPATETLPAYVSDPGSYAVTPVVNEQFFYGGPMHPKA